MKFGIATKYNVIFVSQFIRREQFVYVYVCQNNFRIIRVLRIKCSCNATLLVPRAIMRI